MKAAQYRQSSRRAGRPRWHKPVLIAGIILGGLLLLNGGMWLWYRERTLPYYSLGSMDLGNVPFNELDKRITDKALLPVNVTLQKDETKQTVSIEALGVSVDKQASIASLKQKRTFLPILSLFTHRTVATQVELNEQTFETLMKQLSPVFRKDAFPERVTFSGGSFSVANPQEGYELDQASLKRMVEQDVKRGRTAIVVPVTATQPAAGGVPDVAGEAERLQKQLDTAITYTYGGQNKRPSKSDIGAWYEANGQTMQPSPTRIQSYVGGLFSGINNASEAASATQYALEYNRQTTIVLTAQTTPVKYIYCTAVRGVGQEYLAGFNRKLAATYADPLGWNAGAKVSFVRGDSGCQFTVWLSAPSSMTSFGGVCDAYYSCRSGRNVVINFDRWQGATPPWNQAGGNLEDYRVMVINHETGHWLGFGHATCPGPGQKAPVMMQQSISLGGCAFNPWPVATELTTLKQSLQIAAVMPTGRQEFAALFGSSCTCGSCTA